MLALEDQKTRDSLSTQKESLAGETPTSAPTEDGKIALLKQQELLRYRSLNCKLKNMLSVTRGLDKSPHKSDAIKAVLGGFGTTWHKLWSDTISLLAADQYKSSTAGHDDEKHDEGENDARVEMLEILVSLWKSIHSSEPTSNTIFAARPDVFRNTIRLQAGLDLDARAPCLQWLSLHFEQYSSADVVTDGTSIVIGLCEVMEECVRRDEPHAFANIGKTLANAFENRDGHIFRMVVGEWNGYDDDSSPNDVPLMSRILHDMGCGVARFQLKNDIYQIFGLIIAATLPNEIEFELDTNLIGALVGAVCENPMATSIDVYQFWMNAFILALVVNDGHRLNMHVGHEIVSKLVSGWEALRDCLILMQWCTPQKLDAFYDFQKLETAGLVDRMGRKDLDVRCSSVDRRMAYRVDYLVDQWRNRCIFTAQETEKWENGRPMLEDHLPLKKREIAKIRKEFERVADIKIESRLDALRFKVKEHVSVTGEYSSSQPMLGELPEPGRMMLEAQRNLKQRLQRRVDRFHRFAPPEKECSSRMDVDGGKDDRAEDDEDVEMHDDFDVNDDGEKMDLEMWSNAVLDEWD